jgi:hypothetical protein
VGWPQGLTAPHSSWAAFPRCSRQCGPCPPPAACIPSPCAGGASACGPAPLPLPPCPQVEEVTETEVVCLAKNNAVLDGLLTVFHQVPPHTHWPLPTPCPTNKPIHPACSTLVSHWTSCPARISDHVCVSSWVAACARSQPA